MAKYLDKSGLQKLICMIKSKLDGKIDKADGMGLSQNSFTNAEKSKLAELENYDDSIVLQLISDLTARVENLEENP